MSVFHPQHSVFPTLIDCQGVASVTVSFDAAPELSAKPADIVLIMDRSGSMGGPPMVEAKLAAKALVQTVARASGSADGSTLKNGTRISLVTFSDVATRPVNLVTDVSLLNRHIDAMVAGGDTGHYVGFYSASNVLQNSTAERRIAIMFTDGKTTTGPDPQRIADRMKEQDGIEIYCIGLLTDVEPLKGWASDPDYAHVAFTSDFHQLRQVFTQIASEVVLDGVLDLDLRETVNPDFRITRVHVPSHGTAELLDGQTIRWTADAVGTAGRETAVLRFEIAHIAAVGGTKPVSQSLTYLDRAGTTLRFPDPRITVDCAAEHIWPEPCPVPTKIQVEGCRDAVQARLNATDLLSLGRIVQVDAVIRQVRPNQALAVAVILTEIDNSGAQQQRGMKVLTIPAQAGTRPRDVVLHAVEFAVPQVPDSSGLPQTICKPRNFTARVVANYTDGNFDRLSAAEARILPSREK